MPCSDSRQRQTDAKSLGWEWEDSALHLHSPAPCRHILCMGKQIFFSFFFLSLFFFSFFCPIYFPTSIFPSFPSVPKGCLILGAVSGHPRRALLLLRAGEPSAVQHPSPGHGSGTCCPPQGRDGPGTAPRNGLSWLQHRHKVGRGHCCLFSCPQSHQVRAGRPRLDPPKSPKDFKSTEQINHGITAPARAGSKPCPLCPWLSGSSWAGKHSLWMWGRRDPLFSSSMAQSLPPMSTPGSGLSVCPRERQP